MTARVFLVSLFALLVATAFSMPASAQDPRYDRDDRRDYDRDRDDRRDYDRDRDDRRDYDRDRNSQTFHCESRRKFGYGECRTPFEGRAQLVRQTSRSACIEGRTWGSRYGVVWVNNGCEGDFAVVGRGRGRGGDDRYSVQCKSRDFGLSTCAWPPQNGFPRLIQQISQSPCVEGRSWGYQRGRGLWVSHGCEARFGTSY